MKITNVDNWYPIKIWNLIDNGDIADVIDFIKTQDFYENPINAFHAICIEKINARLEKEGLDYNSVKNA